MSCISSAHIPLVRTESHGPPNCKECWDVYSTWMARGKKKWNLVPPLLSASAWGQFWAVLGVFCISLPWDHSLSCVLSSDLRFSVLSSDLSLLSFYTPCYFTSSRDLCFGQVFTVLTSPFPGFFPTSPVIVRTTVYPALSHLVLLPQPCWTSLTSHLCSPSWAARVSEKDPTPSGNRAIPDSRSPAQLGPRVLVSSFCCVFGDNSEIHQTPEASSQPSSSS